MSGQINTMEGICACGKPIVGIMIHGKEHWFHADGNMYRHMIIPQDEKFHQRADFETMQKDRNNWIDECTKGMIEINKLKKEIDTLRSDAGWAADQHRTEMERNRRDTW